jgi:hypothetical protein
MFTVLINIYFYNSALDNKGLFAFYLTDLAALVKDFTILHIACGRRYAPPAWSAPREYTRSLPVWYLKVLRFKFI